MICGRGGASAAVALVLLAAAGLARAQLEPPDASNSKPRVALLSTVPDDPLAGRIEAELQAVGVDVSRAVLSPATGIEEQVRAALRSGARGVVVADGHRTDVWIPQAGSDRVGLRQDLEVDDTSGLQAVLALRTVEFLRISLGLVSGPPVVPLPAPPITRATVPVAPAPERWMAVDASTGVLASVGGLGAMAVAGIGLRSQLAGFFGAELCAYAPLSDSELSEGAAQTRTSIWLAGGGMVLAPRADRRVSFDAALGALAIFVRSTGTANAPQTGTTGDETGVAMYARAAARFRLARHLALRVDLLGGAALRRPVISFMSTTNPTSDRDLATWGGAFAAGLGGAELRF
ncbi:MAG TPA: hypothetical protein VLC06_17260 [Polyangia bacterium]|nr:hypothetical protein [Polyangia bacterium]